MRYGLRAWLVVSLGLFWVASGAWAHAALVASTPAAGAVLEQAPSAITLVFSEPVRPLVFELLQPSGQRATLTQVTVQGAQVAAALPTTSDSAAPGTYLLSWRVVSADGHPVAGLVNYAVGRSSASPAPAAAEAAAAGLKSAIWLARWLTFVCVFAVAGGLLFWLLQPNRAPIGLRPVAAAGLVLLLADWALQGLDLIGAHWSALLTPAPWVATLATSTAWTLVFLALAMVLALSVVGSRWPAHRWLGAVGVPLVTAGALVLSGHAATAPPQWLARPAVALHVLMGVAWIGSLGPLLLGLRPAGPSDQSGRTTAASSARSSPAAIGATKAPPSRVMPMARAEVTGDRALRVFSAWAPWVVALLVATGVVLASLQLLQPSALWRSAYGQVLLAKLALVALLLGVAAVNRWRLTAPVLAGTLPARRALQRAIGVELVLAAAILAVVSLWRFTPPPRSTAMLPDAHASHGATPAAAAPRMLQHSQLQARIEPGQGAAPWTIALQTPQGTPFVAQEVTLVLNHQDDDIAALRVPAQQMAPGQWQAPVPALPDADRWSAALVVLVDDFHALRLPASTAAADGY